MVKLKRPLATVVWVVIGLLFMWGLSKLIFNIFNIEDDLIQAIINGGLFLGLVITVVHLEKKFTSPD